MFYIGSHLLSLWTVKYSLHLSDHELSIVKIVTLTGKRKKEKEREEKNMELRRKK
jgi:hypothetical protein